MRLKVKAYELRRGDVLAGDLTISSKPTEYHKIGKVVIIGRYPYQRTKKCLRVNADKEFWVERNGS